MFPCSLLSVYDDERSCYRSEVEGRKKYIDQLEQQLNKDYDLITLIKQCLDVSPKKCPSANDIVCVLQKLVGDSYSCYVQLFIGASSSCNGASYTLVCCWLYAKYRGYTSNVTRFFSPFHLEELYFNFFLWYNYILVLRL